MKKIYHEVIVPVLYAILGFSIIMLFIMLFITVFAKIDCDNHHKITGKEIAFFALPPACYEKTESGFKLVK